MGAYGWTYEFEAGHDSGIETVIQALHDDVLQPAGLIDLIGEPAETVHFARQVLDSLSSTSMFSPEVIDELSSAIATQEDENRYVNVHVVRLLTAERLGTGTVLDVDVLTMFSRVARMTWLSGSRFSVVGGD